MSLGERIRKARLAAGLTQQQLGDAIGVNKSTIAGYERGGREPDALKIIGIAKALNVTGDYLLNIEDDMQSRQQVVDSLSKEAIEYAIDFDSLSEDAKRLARGFMVMLKENSINKNKVFQ